jgi:hypothetical protein
MLLLDQEGFGRKYRIKLHYSPITYECHKQVELHGTEISGTVDRVK